MLQLHTFGGCYLAEAGARLDSLTAQRKALALLAILAVAGKRGVSRDSVLALLWPESDEERARTSLKQLVHSVRQQLRAPDVLLSSTEIRLNPDRITSDVEAFRHALGRDDYEAAVALHAGPFLDGFYMKGADDFERWAATERGALAHDFARALEALGEQTLARGDALAATTWWRRLVATEPLSARATTGLMRALAAAGDRASALHHASAFQQLATEELGSADDSVAELVARLKADAALPSSRMRGLGDPPSVAVLPFANTSGDPADEPFSDGLTEELISAISRVPGLTVTGRTSSFALKGRALDVRRIGETLGVATLLEGSVRRSGGRVKVAAQLVSVQDNAVLWADTYDRVAEDIFAVQEEIARATANALRKTLGVGTPLARSMTSLVAYELCLKGRYILNTRTSEERVVQAIRYFEQAIARDASCAAAFAGLSDAHAFLAVFGYRRAHDAIPNAIGAARKALALDDSIAEAHASLGHALCVYDFQWAAAERELRRAIELDPSYTFARIALGICLQDQARFGEAVSELGAAREADPLAPHVYAVLGRVHVNARQPDAAVACLREAVELGPDLDLVHQQLGHAYLQQGLGDEAIGAFSRAAQLTGVRDTAHLAYAYAVTGARARAESIMHSLLDSREYRHVLPFHLAMAYTGLGNIDAAFEWLDRGYEERSSFMDGVKVTPAFDPLHADPRWERLLGRMALSPDGRKQAAATRRR